MAWKKPGDSAEIVEKFLPSKEGDLLQDFALAGVIRVFLKTPSQMILAGFPPSNSCKWSSWWLLVLKRRSHNLYHGIILFPIVSHVVYKVATSHRLNFSNLNDGLPNLPSIAAWWLRMGPDFPVVFSPTSCVGRWPVGWENPQRRNRKVALSLGSLKNQKRASEGPAGSLDGPGTHTAWVCGLGDFG